MGGRRILLVDNGSESRHRTGFLLKLSGYEVSPFNNGSEALNWLRQTSSSGERYALLLVSAEKADAVTFLVAEREAAAGYPLPLLQLERGDIVKNDGERVYTCAPTRLMEKLAVLLGGGTKTEADAVR